MGVYVQPVAGADLIKWHLTHMGPSCTLQNPNVVGSGYIAHPPQKPFEKPLTVQPTTIQVGGLARGGMSLTRCRCRQRHLRLAGRGRVGGVCSHAWVQGE